MKSTKNQNSDYVLKKEMLKSTKLIGMLVVNLTQTRKQERQNGNDHLEGSVVDNGDYDQDVSHLWNNNILIE